MTASSPSLKPIKRLRLKFHRHQSDKELSDALNRNFSDDFVNFDSIYENSAKTIISSNLTKNVLTMISDQLIKPFVTHTADPYLTVTHLIQNAQLSVEEDDGTTSRLTINSLSGVINSTKRDVIYIVIHMDHVSYDYSQDQLDVLNWDNLFDGTPTGRTTPTSTSPADIAAAVATAIQASVSTQTTDPTVLGKAIANAMAPLLPKPSATSVSTAALSGFTAIPTSHLPTDVRRRWENFRDKKILPGSATQQPYSNGHFYFDENTHICLSNGQVFHSNRDPDEKLLMKMACWCPYDNMTGVRTWYKELTKTLFSCGIFCLPLWNFRPDHGGTRGFTIGPSKDDDLPDRMLVSIEKYSGIIYRFLKHPSMFPKDSQMVDIVLASDGDGHVALCSILRLVHPHFHKHPTRFLKNYPRQNGKSFQEYYNFCVDYQQLRAIVFDECRTFDNPNELDMLLDNSDYPAYLHQVTRHEREQPSFASHYTGPEVLQTILKKLTAADSPTKRPPRSQMPPSRASARVQFIETENDQLNNEDDITDELDPTLTEVAIQEFPIPDLDVPEGQENLFADYEASIAAINAKPKLAYSAACIVCEGHHSFADCPTLKNQDFLRSHYIRYCQLLRRDHNALTRPAQSNSARGGRRDYPQRQERHVNYVDALFDEPASYETGESEDFLEGRI